MGPLALDENRSFPYHFTYIVRKQGGSREAHYNQRKGRPLKKLLSVKTLMVLTTIVSLALLLGASWKWRPF